MKKEELREKRNRTIESLDDIKAVLGLDELYIDELEEKISVLLSCKNCSENKDGYICEKEYNDKCLAQKIEFIKELQKENAELKSDNDARKFAMAMSEKVEKKLREENVKLNRLSDMQDKAVVDLTETCEQRRDQLTKAKEIIKKLKALYLYPVVTKDDVKRQAEILVEAEQFLNSEVEK